MAVTQSPPPYASFGVFKATTTETLADSVVPTGPLDRRVLDGLSGADYGSLISALKFLGFATEDRKATQAYRDLVGVAKQPDKFKAALLNVLSEKYRPILGHVDIQHGTLAELEKAFRDAGVAQGQMLTKTIRFYTKAMQECGVDVSPHITKARKAAPVKRENGSRKKTKNNDTGADPKAPKRDQEEIPTPGFERLPIPGLANAYIQYPASLTEANCDLFDAMIGVLRTYVKGRTAKEKKS
jgi:hypothetical protein